MNVFYFVYEVDPRPENPVIGHVSKAMAHLWIFSSGFDEAKDKAFGFLDSEYWDISKEIKGYELNIEHVGDLSESDLSSYQKAKTEGMSSNFYYWHRSD